LETLPCLILRPWLRSEGEDSSAIVGLVHIAVEKGGPAEASLAVDRDVLKDPVLQTAAFLCTTVLGFDCLIVSSSDISITNVRLTADAITIRAHHQLPILPTGVAGSHGGSAQAGASLRPPNLLLWTLPWLALGHHLLVNLLLVDNLDKEQPVARSTRSCGGQLVAATFKRYLVPRTAQFVG